MDRVLALKYRPRQFEDVIGQETVSRTLSLALDRNKLSHAYLFSGLRGSGKTSTARIFAKALLCANGVTSRPCDRCENCTMAAEGRHMDIVEMDAASNRKIDDIRDVIEQTKYKPAVARFKIFIIDEVHMLTKEAFNALLKTLEEPPEYVKFILATTDPLKLPATILSRTQHFRFKRIKDLDIQHHLEHILRLEKVDFEPEATAMLARSGGGSLRDTLTMLDQAIVYAKGMVDVASVVEMLGILDPQVMDSLFTALFSGERERVVKMIREMEETDPETVVDEVMHYLKEKLYAGDPRFPPFVMERFFRILSETKSLLYLNADTGFALGLMMMKMMEALAADELDEQIKRLETEMVNALAAGPVRKSPPAAPATPPQPRPTPAAAPSPEATPPPEPAAPAPIIPPAPDGQELFARLTEAVYNRNYDLGRCFAENVSFVAYDGKTLEWMSCAEGECKQQLKTFWSVIRTLVQETFGVETAISMVPCDKTPEPEPEPSRSAPEPAPEPTTSQMPPLAAPLHMEAANENSGSMVEEVEGGSSCIQNCATDGQAPTPELNVEEVLETPFVKKAMELFEAKNITILQKT